MAQAEKEKRIPTLRPVYISTDLHQKFKIKCVANQEQIKVVTAQLIKEYLKKKK